MTLYPDPNNNSTQNNTSNSEGDTTDVIEAQQSSENIEEDDVENFLKSLDNLEPEGVSLDPTLPTPELSMANSNLSSDREELEDSVNLDNIPDFEIPPTTNNTTTTEVDEDLNPQSVDDQQDVDILADRSLPHFESIDSSEAHDSRTLDQEELSFEEDPPELSPNEQDTSHLDPLSPKSKSLSPEKPEKLESTENLDNSENKEEIIAENELGLINEYTSDPSKTETSNTTETEAENIPKAEIQEELKLDEAPIIDEIQEQVQEIQLEEDVVVDEVQEKSENTKLEEDQVVDEIQQVEQENQPSPQQISPTQVAPNVDSLFESTQGLDSFFDQSYTSADPTASFFESLTPQGIDDPLSQIYGAGEQVFTQDQSSYMQQPSGELAYDPSTGAEYQDQYNQYDPNYAYDPNQQAVYDPNQQGYGNYTSEQDPSTGYDYSQYYPEQGYDPNAYYGQAYDPNNPQTYDQSAYYDPNSLQNYDPNAYYDPNNPQSYDQSTYYDPNSSQAYDPNAYYDPNAVQQYDPNSTNYDPNTVQQYDPNVQTAYDPNVQTAYDPNSYYDQSAYETYDQSGYYIQDTQQIQADESYYTEPNKINHDTTQYQTQGHQSALSSEDKYASQTTAVEYDTKQGYQEPPSQYADNPNLTPRLSAKDSTDYFEQIVEPTTGKSNLQSEDYSTNFTETRDFGAPPTLPIGQTNDDPATLSVFESNTPEVLSPGFDGHQYGTHSLGNYNLNSDGITTGHDQYTDDQDTSATITSVINEQNTGSPFIPTGIASSSIPVKNQYSSFDSYSSTQNLNSYDSTSREIQPSFGYQPPQSSEFEYASISANVEPDEIEIRARRAPYPILTFGFGGKLVTSFYRKVSMYSGDSIAENATPGEIRVGDLKTHLPPTDSFFIGPLWTGNSKHHKKVETQIIEFIQSYLKLSNQGGVSSAEEGELRDSRNILLKVLITMIETQGKLFGDDAAEAKLHALFESSALSPPIPPETIESPTKAPNDSCLPEVFDLLQKGSRSEASKLAANNGHWAHALIISSCAGKEVWQDTIRKFIQSELKSTRNVAHPDALGALYGLFAGLGKQAIKDMFPVSENSPTPPWKDVLRMICVNRTPGDLVAIVTLGDQLLAKGNIYAAHICYLLSSPTAVLGGMDTPSVRWILAGSSISPLHFKDWESIRWTEIIEFAQGLTSNTPGIPHLQSYKINYAWNLLDYGEIDAAASYCEAIINTVKAHTKGSPHFHSYLINQVKFLSDRIAKCGGSKNAASEFGAAWLTGKLSTPSFDSLMSAVDRRLNQLITGDDDYSSSNKSSEIKELKPGPTVFNYGAGSTGASSPYGSTSGGYLPNHLTNKQGVLSSPFGHHSVGDQDSVPFINLDQQFVPQTSTPTIGSPSRPPPTINQIDDDDDDLGFGNKALKKKPDGAPLHQSTPSEGTIKTPKEDKESEHSRSKSSGGGSMFGSILKVFSFGGGGGGGSSTNSNDASPSRVKANLGEESSFYFDEKEKRWVNKNAPAAEAAPTLPPPPPKSMTSSSGPPMPSMDRAPPMSHSTPATTGNSPSTMSPPSGLSTPGGPPTMGRRGGRKNLKNRYVDVMNN